MFKFCELCIPAFCIPEFGLITFDMDIGTVAALIKKKIIINTFCLLEVKNSYHLLLQKIAQSWIVVVCHYRSYVSLSNHELKLFKSEILHLGQWSIDRDTFLVEWQTIPGSAL